MDLSYHLAEFVRVFNVMGDISPSDKRLMYTATLVFQHMEKKTPKEEFQVIIDKENLQEKVTGAYICDFQYGEEVEMAQVAKKHGGLWEAHVDTSNDPEDNEIYAVFSTPMDAYSFMGEAIR
jgi:hypothetical protein